MLWYPEFVLTVQSKNRNNFILDDPICRDRECTAHWAEAEAHPTHHTKLPNSCCNLTRSSNLLHLQPRKDNWEKYCLSALPSDQKTPHFVEPNEDTFILDNVGSLRWIPCHKKKLIFNVLMLKIKYLPICRLCAKRYLVDIFLFPLFITSVTWMKTRSLENIFSICDWLIRILRFWMLS